MLKILQARLQLYVNDELPDVQAGFRKGRGTRDQIANIRWVTEKAREFQENIYFCFIEIDGETVETVSDFIFGAPKSLQMVTAAMKLKDAYSLKEKLWPT